MTTTALKLSFSGIKEKSFAFPAINWKAICILGIFVSSCALLFYIYQINNLTKGAYLINNYEKKISELSQENKTLQVTFAESSFLGGVNSKIRELNFQKTTSVKYIQILDSSLAAAK